MEMCWSRKKMTLYSSNARRTSAMVSSASVVAQVDARDLGADRRAERLHAEMVIGLLLSVGVDGSQRARSDVKLRHRSSPSCPLLTRCPCEVNATRGHAKTCRTPRVARMVPPERTRMSFTGRSCARRALVMAVGFLVALAARPALSDVDVRFERLDGFAAPGTPAKLNKVGVLEIGPKRAQNILVLNPGTSASAAYFAPLAKTIVAQGEGLAGVGGRAPREPARGPLGARPGEGRHRRRASSCSTTTSAGSPTRASRTTSSSSPTPTSRSRASGA